MKLLTFTADGRTRLGAWHDGKVVDLNAAAKLSADGPQEVAADMRRLIQAGEGGRKRAAAALAMAEGLDPVGAAGVVFERSAVQLEAPVTDPQKIIAIGLNYRDHCVEQDIPVPEVMTVFAKFPSALTGDGQPIKLPPADVSQQVDFEAEMAVVIGEGGVNIPESEAMRHVFGYTICHDVSARDVQFGDGGKQWLHGKSFDTFAPMGPWLVTADEIADPHTLDITMDVNGQRLQDSNTKHLVFTVPYLISELSKSLTLYPGDIISTGTPGGVGVFREPPIFLKHGDVCTITVAGIGELTNPVAG